MRMITIQAAARAADYLRRGLHGTWSRGRRIHHVYTASLMQSWLNMCRRTLTTTPEDIEWCTVTSVQGLPPYHPTTSGTVHLWRA